MRAAAEAWSQLRPGVAVHWSFRPLAAFNDQPLAELAERFDLLVVDHPFVGSAARASVLAKLDELVEPETLADLAADAIGASHASYDYAGSQWGLAADAACQVAAVRDDLLPSGTETPSTWGGVLELARALPGRVAIPLYPTDAICSLLTTSASLGAPAGHGDAFFASAEAGERALRPLLELAPLLHPESAELNPPRCLDRMRDTDEIAYAPLTFGYTNYARPGGRGARLRFLAPPGFDGGPAVSLLGGAGLAVSAASAQPREAADFAAWVCGRAAQRDVVFAAGGQPASRSAWLDPELDETAGGFFSATRDTIEAAHVRPREPWWPGFQESAGYLVACGLVRQAPAGEVVAELERAFAAAREHADRRAA
jgi:multiple sugar transport system substrate-binding protein